MTHDEKTSERCDKQEAKRIRRCRIAKGERRLAKEMK